MSAPRLTDTPAPDEPAAYAQDFYTWTLDQA
ncbi:MAG: hypothetical protein JWQ05_2964, partial [Methylobacterium sp.]|nr:hypothetical protein [Methylobacterium sp.]